MDKNQLKKMVCDTINQHASEIIEIGDAIFAHPELGYKEYKTSELVKKVFDKIGLSYQDKLALTGIKAKLKSKDSANGINVCIIGELDAIICPLHPNADPATGAAHSCGHNGQIASMLGTAFGLALSGVSDSLCGNVYFMAVPAEECVELEYRAKLIKEGKISYLGGKQELIHQGVFDNIDISMIVHGMEDVGKNTISVMSDSVGFVTKKVNFIGKESHAGLSPDQGINALNAASLALMAINAQRETFRDEDYIRVHPIITKGGDMVNIVPADVRMETYVRGRDIDAIKNANDKVNRAITGSAYAIGATAEIDDVPGYLPVKQNKLLSDLFLENAKSLFDTSEIQYGGLGGASSDVGDVSTIMPAIQPAMGGFKGGFHSQNLTVCDKNMAYIAPAKAMAMTVIDLLVDNAESAKQVKASYKGMSTTEYDALWKNMLAKKSSI